MRQTSQLTLIVNRQTIHYFFPLIHIISHPNVSNISVSLCFPIILPPTRAVSPFFFTLHYGISHHTEFIPFVFVFISPFPPLIRSFTSFL
jgi:hypothetical protein